MTGVVQGFSLAKLKADLKVFPTKKNSIIKIPAKTKPEGPSGHIELSSGSVDFIRYILDDIIKPQIQKPQSDFRIKKKDKRNLVLIIIC
jgi:hypothetical protein